ncbi:MAG TPA: riboflavin biosynthesis protein RibF [Candidatus Atribacteria bacterium]|nr:riboflavin biosynthesis protein RibF [Candidatus Atribacteria bacterium]HQE24444.1 riboflavin biosynthesis protein RibF [Candidatus Atribacteria bacterium]
MWIRGIDSVEEGDVLALGFFDGVHRGHQYLLGEAYRLAQERKRRLQILTFYPHPQNFLSTGRDIKHIVTYREKYFLIQKLFPQSLVCFVHFNKSFREKKAYEFLALIEEKVKPQVVVVGENFRFGFEAQGDAELLKNYFSSRGTEVIVVPTLQEGGDPISSSRIRWHLENGDLLSVNHLLGYSFFLQGRVRRGRGMGRKLGFPTANFYPPSYKLLPLSGVYAGSVSGKEIGNHNLSLIYVGNRPTVNFSPRRLVEVFIPGVCREFYGERLTIEFQAFLREEMVFSSLEELKNQIGRDLEALYISAARCKSSFYV